MFPLQVMFLLVLFKKERMGEKRKHKVYVIAMACDALRGAEFNLAPALHFPSVSWQHLCHCVWDPVTVY